MGLAITKNLQSGITLNDSYVKVFSFYGDKQRVSFTLNTYISRQACLEGKTAVSSESYAFIPDVSNKAPNFIRQMYLYVKQMPDYAKSLDVLEEGQY